jgi:hypothetical protein
MQLQPTSWATQSCVRDARMAHADFNVRFRDERASGFGHFRSFEERAEICPNRTIDPISRAPATPNAVIGARNVD